jgi:hypothetical protein
MRCLYLSGVAFLRYGRYREQKGVHVDQARRDRVPENSLFHKDALAMKYQGRSA